MPDGLSYSVAEVLVLVSGYLSGFGPSAPACSGLDQADNGRHDGYEQNKDDDQFEVLLDGRDTAEEVTQEGEKGGPDQAPQNTEGCEPAPLHPRDPRDERHEGPDEGEEAA